MAYVAILAGTVLIMFLGFIWFHPKVLGGPWMKGAGLTEEEIKEFSPFAMIGGILMAVVISWALSRYASHTQEGMAQFVHGLYHGMMTALTLIAPVLVSKSLFERKSPGWILISTGYWVLAITLAGGVIYALTPPSVA